MPIVKQREQVVEPIDPCSVCAVEVEDAVRVIAREGNSGDMDGAKREKVRCPFAPACASKLIFNSLERK